MDPSPRVSARVIAGCVSALLAGCDDPTHRGPRGTDTTLPTATSFAVTHSSGRSGKDGILAVDVEIDAPGSSLLVTGQSVAFVGVERVVDPDGDQVVSWEDWWYTDEALSNAFFAFDRTTAFNWPVRAVDGELSPGTWTVELYTADAAGEYAGREEVDVTVQTKVDPDLGAGEVLVHVFWARGVDDDPALVEAVTLAESRWRDVWAEAGVELLLTHDPTELDPDLGFTYVGDADLEALTSDLGEDALVMVIGDTIDGDLFTYGVAGGIPGTLAASPMTFVVVSWQAHAGADGSIDAEESRLMGETMAHEASHYMGLFHPVEFGRRYQAVGWDALDDTEACDGYYGCEGLSDNLMYPYSVCDLDGVCVPQHLLTAEQRGVVHRYVGAL